uniref:t-SNARE coiled-coil homology domain-containing protein n=1 Tax=Panagrellus redivivus TaxID=6233 RepID=A0A7E4WA58_PANRE
MTTDSGNDLVQEIAKNIFALNQIVQKLEDAVYKIDTTPEHERITEYVNSLIQQSNDLSPKTNTMMKQLNILAKTNGDFAIHRKRLMNEYFGVLRRLQEVQRTAATKERQKIKTVSDQDHYLSNQTPPEQDQIRLQMQQQHRQNILEVRERQQALVGFENDIQQLNEIFTDLARIVHDQGETIDSIEANVENATIQVDQGASNVRSALEYETRARQKKLMLGIFCAALVLVLLLFFYLYSR